MYSANEENVDQDPTIGTASVPAQSDLPQEKRRRDPRSSTRPLSYRGRRHGDHGGRLRLLQITSGLLGIALAMTLIGWIHTEVRLNGERQESYQLAVASRNQGQELDRLRAEVTRLKADLQTMVRKRIPHVHPLQFDTVLPMNVKYLRTISFTRTGVDEAVQYEYQIIVECLDKDPVIPKVSILLFDELGIQVGAADVTHKAATSTWAVEFLAPGERRAYTASIPLSRKATPEFFLVTVE